MGHTLPCMILLFQAAFGFNIDPVVWKSFGSPVDGDGFGYKVVQRQSSLLVSAPLSRDRSGQIYKCSTEKCRPMSIKVPDFAVNMSLGLTMTNDPTTGKTIACGPTIPRDCKTITTYNGVCLEISENDNVGKSVPSSLEECPGMSADIAFLLDGSGSVVAADFIQMKTFVKSVIRSLMSRDKQFAVAQYSTNPHIHYYFDDFDTSGYWESQIDLIKQQRGWTYTAKAIQHVVNNVFSGSRGSRPNVNKVLIVITDGASNDRNDLSDAASLAARKGIIRFAIGVGSAFDDVDAKAELDTIATNPNNVFRVTGFTALNEILKSLQDRIFSIEGSQTSGGSLKLEMAQEGFSAAYVPGGGFQMAAVGAFQWRGSYRYQEISTGQRGDFTELTDMVPDSYLGYSMAVATRRSGILTVVGAPRYKHMGMVMVFSSRKSSQKIDPSTDSQFQIGSYFGAEVCTMDVDRNGYTDIILISAPSFMERDREGRVYVCSLTDRYPYQRADCLSERQPVLKGVAGERGRFGSSLAPLPDLNSDGFNDLAVGAPLENDGQGSIYIFHGDGRRTINPIHSQRIPGSDVQPRLRFFGLSISQSSFDLSGDRLVDLAVGSKGAVLLLRSKPIVKVEAQVTFSPNKISTNNPDCNSPLKNTARVCFIMRRHSTVKTAQARINYTLTLDSTRNIPNNRAYIKKPNRELSKSFILDMAKTPCFSHEFDIEACPDDALNELSNELRFTFEGLPSPDKLSPSLEQQAQTTTKHPLGFEINCGTDDLCTDNLKIDFNFTSSTSVKVGIDELLNVTVSVENREENSYNSRVTLTYPPGLSYRKFTMQQGRVECNSIDSEDGLSRGKSDCTIDKPIFKSNAKAVFMVSYGIDTNSELDRKMLITANASSGNAGHSKTSELYQEKKIDVKYSIFLSIPNPSSLYTNFTFGNNDLQTPLLQSITVQNAVRACNVTVVIKVPVKLGDKDIWVNPSSIKIPGCSRSKDEEPNFPDFVNKIKKNYEMDCSVTTCTVFRCNVSMVKDQREVYNIPANLSSGWIEQIGLQSAKFSLISTATLEYDRDQYIFDSPESKNNPPVKKIVATVEVYTETDRTPWIIGGTVGGLVLLAVITAGLYKAGFFKSQYNQMIADQGGEGPEDGGAQPPE